MSARFDHARRIDKVCDAFEAAWNADHSVTIEPFLESLPHDPASAEALTSLLLLEMELRTTIGPLPSLEATVERFPQHRDVVLVAYRDAVSYASDKELPEKLGHYRVERSIGRGRYGSVYRAFDLRLRRVVALKVLHRWYSESESFVRRFELEAQAAADLDDPNVCQVLDIGFEEGRHFYAMQYCDGDNLAEVLAKRKRLPVANTVELIAKLARALDRMHARGLIHRDLKPANVLIAESGEPLIADFGLAHDHGNELVDDPLSTAGTPAYMAPEQFYGQSDAAPALDIYSLGAMLFELLTGKPPTFSSSLSSSDIEQALAEHGLPAHLISVCQSALATDPSDRHVTAREFADALEASVRPKQLRHLLLASVVLLIVAGIVSVWRVRTNDRTAKQLNPKPADSQADEKTPLAPSLAMRSPTPPADRKARWAKPELYQQDWSTPPIPLDEWLAGRETLTVAQDGSAMFTTISEAFKNLRREQVIRVLDSGPYRERLHLNRTPYDVGLVSDVGTRIEIPDWRQAAIQPNNPIFEGCVFDRSVGFRLSGFHFLASKTPRRQSARACIVRVRATGSKNSTLPLIIEDCQFLWDAADDWSNRSKITRPEQLFSLQVVATRNSSPVYLQRCRLENCVDLNINTPALVAQNVISGIHSYRGINIHPSLGQNISVLENLIFARTAIQFGFRDAGDFRGLEQAFAHPTYRIVGNYMEGEVGVSVRPPDADASDFRVPDAYIARNVFFSPFGVHFTSTVDAEFAAENWQHHDNAFLAPQTDDDATADLPRHPTEVEFSDAQPTWPLLPDMSQVWSLLNRLNRERDESSTTFGPQREVADLPPHSPAQIINDQLR